MKARHIAIILLLLMNLAISACQVGPISISWGKAPPTPSGELVYQGPVKLTLAAGDDLPGTDVHYVGKSDKGAELLIEGQQAFKRKADSVDWHGPLTEGITLDLSTRIAWFTEEALHLVGMARVTVQNPTPQASPITTKWPIEYRTSVSYAVSLQGYIPGTLIQYLGQTDKGAQLAGVEGYPYRKVIDSITWEGKLKEDVFLKLDLRVVRYTKQTLDVAGLATIWVVR